jgi:predicted dienelactone hydrolase
MKKDKHIKPALMVFVFILCSFAASCGSSSSDSSSQSPELTAVVQPLPLPGPYPVAFSNLSQDFTKVGPDENVADYWEGRTSTGGTKRYIFDLLSDPGNSLTLTLTAPQDTDLYGDFAGQAIPFVLLVCYPTTADNPQPAYPLNPPQTDLVLSHMQTGAQDPIFADSTVRYPLVVFSHGYQGSPISSSDYLSAVTNVASYGYIVVALFHGDLRFTDLDISNLSDAINIVTNLNNFTALQALRPLSVSAALDLILNHPQWTGHIDPTQIGGFGASMGGETMMLLAGAGLTTSYFDLGASWQQVTRDTRIKAAVGYIPYFGQPVLPAFGNNQQGVDGVNLPFLGISGTSDAVAPISETIDGMSMLTGPRRLVALTGVTHGFDTASTNDIFTWTLTFLNAEVKGDPDAISVFSAMASVAGGGDDNVVLQ